MQFTRVSNWAEVSGCGRYSVAATKHGDAFSFQAWRTGNPGELLYTGTAEQCRQACADHAAGKNLAPETYQPQVADGR